MATATKKPCVEASTPDSCSSYIVSVRLTADDSIPAGGLCELGRRRAHRNASTLDSGPNRAQRFYWLS